MNIKQQINDYIDARESYQLSEQLLHVRLHERVKDAAMRYYTDEIVVHESLYRRNWGQGFRCSRTYRLDVFDKITDISIHEHRDNHIIVGVQYERPYDGCGEDIDEWNITLTADPDDQEALHEEEAARIRAKVQAILDGEPTRERAALQDKREKLQKQLEELDNKLE